MAQGSAVTCQNVQAKRLGTNQGLLEEDWQ